VPVHGDDAVAESEEVDAAPQHVQAVAGVVDDLGMDRVARGHAVFLHDADGVLVRRPRLCPCCIAQVPGRTEADVPQGQVGEGRANGDELLAGAARWGRR
jgi:hypothetical protein